MASSTWNESDFLLENASFFINDSQQINNGLEVVPEEVRDPLYVVVPVTVMYALIFFTGVFGNVSTCIVIARNKCMHTATNYYLFSLAVSDLLLLLSGLPPEMYRLWWPQVYIFGEMFCMVQSISAETSANATVLTITAFTVERYIAICHPFLTHTMSKLSRAVKFVVAVWFLALCLAIPQAIQYGIWYGVDEQGNPASRCTITRLLIEHTFEVSTLVFFVGPMTVITVLYVLIALKLRGPSVLNATNGHSASSGDEMYPARRRSARTTAAQNRVVKMLVAVVVAFFLCWAPFHAQRLLAVYISRAYKEQQPPGPAVHTLYFVLNYISGVLYFMSTCINPFLYNIMSHKFREAFKTTLAQLCGDRHNRHSLHSRTYSTLSRYQTSLRHHTQPLQPAPQSNVLPAHLTDRSRTTHEADENLIQSSHPFRQPLSKADLRNEKKSRPSRSRGNSTSSQMTVLTSLSRSNTCDAAVNGGIRNGRIAYRSVKRRKKGSKLNFSALAQRLRSFTMCKPDEDPQKLFVRQKSVDSANTISDSSLQDLDETEFSSSDLVRYMEEINQDIS